MVVLLILWIAIIRPIEALRVTTAAVSAGDLTARAPVMGRDEVGDLAADFNLMIERLECSHADQRRNSAEISRKNEELFATAQLLNGVLAGVSDSAIVALDLDGQVVTFNRGAEAVFRCSMHAALGRPFRDFLAADERHHLQEILAFAGRGADVVERVRAMRPDAHELPMLLTVTSRRDTREQQIGFVVVGRDLTREDFEHELMVRNRELEQASRAKNEFLANMSHELRTPLNAIIGFSELLGDGLMGEINAEQHKASDAILQSGRHLLGLINEILDLSKVEAGEMKLAIEVVPCLEPIESAIAVAMPLAEKKRLTLTHDFGEALSATVRCDVARFRQILLNLLGNAIKFTESGGTVHVRVRLEPALVAVDVEDTGIGITPADLGRLFQKFQQLENLHTKRHGGTGLGLALSKALAELQGGTITVQSEAGRGSCFTVWLPRATPLAGAAPRHPGALELPP
ncbi:MAG: ATP-binding protein [Planctomycetota bacterium]